MAVSQCGIFWGWGAMKMNYNIIIGSCCFFGGGGGGCSWGRGATDGPEAFCFVHLHRQTAQEALLFFFGFSVKHCCKVLRDHRTAAVPQGREQRIVLLRSSRFIAARTRNPSIDIFNKRGPSYVKG